MDVKISIEAIQRLIGALHWRILELEARVAELEAELQVAQ